MSYVITKNFIVYGICIIKHDLIDNTLFPNNEVSSLGNIVMSYISLVSYMLFFITNN